MSNPTPDVRGIVTNCGQVHHKMPGGEVDHAGYKPHCPWCVKDVEAALSRTPPPAPREVDEHGIDTVALAKRHWLLNGEPPPWFIKALVEAEQAAWNYSQMRQDADELEAALSRTHPTGGRTETTDQRDDYRQRLTTTVGLRCGTSSREPIMDEARRAALIERLQRAVDGYAKGMRVSGDSVDAIQDAIDLLRRREALAASAPAGEGR